MNTVKLPPEIINHIISFSRNRLPTKLLTQIEMFQKPIEFIFETIYKQFPHINPIFYYVYLSSDISDFFIHNHNNTFDIIFEDLSEKDKAKFQYNEQRFLMYMSNFGFISSEYWTPKQHIFKIWKYLKSSHICFFIEFLRSKYGI